MHKLIIFTLGAVGYPILELCWRGYTHWTMELAGGICLLMIYLIEDKLPKSPIFIKCILSAAVITLTELIIGIIFNILLKWEIWNYSDMPYNLFGQICLEYIILWFLLSIPVLFLCKAVRLRTQS